MWAWLFLTVGIALALFATIPARMCLGHIASREWGYAGFAAFQVIVFAAGAANAISKSGVLQGAMQS